MNDLAEHTCIREHPWIRERPWIRGFVNSWIRGFVNTREHPSGFVNTRLTRGLVTWSTRLEASCIREPRGGVACAFIGFCFRAFVGCWQIHGLCIFQEQGRSLAAAIYLSLNAYLTIATLAESLKCSAWLIGNSALKGSWRNVRYP